MNIMNWLSIESIVQKIAFKFFRKKILETPIKINHLTFSRILIQKFDQKYTQEFLFKPSYPVIHGVNYPQGRSVTAMAAREGCYELSHNCVSNI
jgi:hypothetical protein